MHQGKRNACWLMGLMMSASAAGTPFTVTSTGDNGGVNPAPGAGTGTLRQAIVDANAAAGDDEIDFAIPGSGPHTITLAGQLPGISGNLVINGSTQSVSYVFNTNAPDEGGINAQPLIEINGNGQTYGLYASG